MQTQKKNSILFFLIVFADMMGFSVLFPLFPETIKHYMNFSEDPVFRFFYNLALEWGDEGNLSYTIVLFGGILGSVYSILQFLFSPIWGKMSDSFGRKKILAFTSFGNFLGYCLWLFSTSFTLFVLSRVITGAMGGNISVASAGMADSTSREDRAKGMGMIGAGIGLGFIFGPTLGGAFSKVEIYDWLPFLEGFGFTVFSTSALVSVIISLLNLVLVIFVLEETLPESVVEDSGKFHPFLDMFHTNYKGLLGISFIYLAFIYSFSGFEFSLNFFLNEFMEFSPAEIGMTFFYLGVIIILIQGGLIRRISGKVAERKIALVAFLFLTLGYLGILSATYYPSVVWLLFVLGILAIGSALMHPALSSIASLRSSALEQGKNLGIFRSFGSLGRAISPLSYAILYFGFTEVSVFLFSLFLTLVLGISLLFVREKS